MRAGMIVAGVAAFCAFAVPAGAITVANRDDVSRKVTVIEGDKRSEHVLQPAQLLENICLAGCIVRLDDNVDPDEDYELEGDEIVTIEDGALYHDDRPPPGIGSRAPTPVLPTPAPRQPATPAIPEKR